jgi:hypothetical protein
MLKSKTPSSRQSNDRRMGVCEHAPEWAEHARFIPALNSELPPNWF